ncbi:MAG TPA: helix-turn-helix domain-containing protein [Streptosporangiaceae bacterium]|jgi:transcriptional regulator with XRE-family HTH domain
MAAVASLGEFLRARRARIRPADVGLPAGLGLRRTPGLRREELAALAGISIDYCIRLEQGRETNPSAAVLDALASALLLDQEERAHLLALARQPARLGAPAGDQRHARGHSRPGQPDAVRPEIRQLLETLRPCPAYVLNRISDMLAANPEALALFAGIEDWPAPRRNTARYTFLHPAARELFADWPHSAATTAANLRAVAAADPHVPGLAELIAELTAQSPEFARLWQRYDIRQRRGEPKTFRHPRLGMITLTYEVLQLDADGQRMSVYQAAPGSTDEDTLALLALLAGEAAAGRPGPADPPGAVKLT